MCHACTPRPLGGVWDEGRVGAGVRRMGTRVGECEVVWDVGGVRVLLRIGEGHFPITG